MSCVRIKSSSGPERATGERVSGHRPEALSLSEIRRSRIGARVFALSEEISLDTASGVNPSRSASSRFEKPSPRMRQRPSGKGVSIHRHCQTAGSTHRERLGPGTVTVVPAPVGGGLGFHSSKAHQPSLDGRMRRKANFRCGGRGVVAKKGGWTPPFLTY